jgi:hypothetical protein
MFYPGHTIAFDRRKMDDCFRHVVISRESSNLSQTYMRLVGVDKAGTLLPFDDPLYPSFILVALTLRLPI